MKSDFYEKLSKKHMTRREFLQFTASSFLVLLGLGNIIALVGHVKKTSEPATQTARADHGFGSRKFGA